MINLVIMFLSIAINSGNDYHSTECTGIVISKKKFDRLVEHLNSLYEKGGITKKDDYVLSVRVYNTIVTDELKDKEQYLLFYNNFNTYFEQTVKFLEAEVSHGMGLYSKKYNVHIGGAQQYAGSVFCLV